MSIESYTTDMVLALPDEQLDEIDLSATTRVRPGIGVVATAPDVN